MDALAMWEGARVEADPQARFPRLVVLATGRGSREASQMVVGGVLVGQ